MSRADFWSLHPVEYHWLFESKRPTKMYGDMTESEVEEIYARAYGEPEEDHSWQ